MNRTQALILALALPACGGASERTITGSIDLADFGRTSAELVAVRAGGVERAAAIAQDGTFELALEPGHATAFAFRAEERGRFVRFANVVFETARGRASAVQVTDGAPIAIGDFQSNERSSCRGMPDPAGGGEPQAPAIILFSSFLLTADDRFVAENAEAGDDNGGLTDSDGDDRPDALDDDDDGDGVCDDDDGDDDGPGEDRPDGGDGGRRGGDDGRAELPYDARLEIGDTFALEDAFAEEGPQPAEILSVEMDGGDWRLEELRAGVRFTVTEDDCRHEGNRDTGRDRIFVGWRNTDGSTEIDHLDLRYCD